MTKQKLPAFPPMIMLESDPIPIAAEFSSPLASIIIEWSRVEIGIQTDLDALYQLPQVRRLTAELPRSFIPSVKLWRKAIKVFAPEIDAYQMLADNIRDLAVELAPKRNHLIHGLWDIGGVGADGRWDVRNFKQTSAGYADVQAKVLPEELSGLADQVRSLSGKIAGFTASRMLHLQRGWVQLNKS